MLKAFWPRTFVTSLRLTILLLAAGSCGSSEDNRPADWNYISSVIFQPNCATVSCHSRATAASGLDFSDPERGYTSLSRLRFQIIDAHATGDDCKTSNGTTACPRGYRPLVSPFDPTGSRLVRLLREKSSPRMPPDRPLFEADIKLIETWILLGATKDAAPASAPRSTSATNSMTAGEQP